MKKLGWKAIGYTLWMFGMAQLLALPFHMMSQPNTVEFNFGVVLLLTNIGALIYGFIKLMRVGLNYIDYLTNKEEK